MNSAQVLENTELWDLVFTTDPSAVKKITGKSYQGNSPKPYWLFKRATEVFGACGKGWGIKVKSQEFTKVSDTDTLHTAVVVVWYIYRGERCEVEHVGGTKAVYMTGAGKLMVDDDAAKKSVTDGAVKALSMIGFAGDIFSGRWDDSKYQDEAVAVTAARESSVNKDKSAAALAKAQQEAIEAENQRLASMGLSLKNMRAATEIDALKEHFKDAWEISTKEEKDSLKASYNSLKEEILSALEAAMHNAVDLKSLNYCFEQLHSAADDKTKPLIKADYEKIKAKLTTTEGK